MAIPLNVFKTTTAVLKSGPFIADSDVIYTVPNGITTIVLMAQVANITDEDSALSASMTHFDVNTTIGTEVVKNFLIQPNDAAGLLTGKLIVEQNNKIKCSASKTDKLKLILSYLESLNG